jgi:uncharacterized protein
MASETQCVGEGGLAMLQRILTGVIIALMLTGGAVAGPFEDGLAVYQRGDYATALRLWRPLAEQGGAEAQYNLGIMYYDGDGVPQNYAEAIKWHRLAAEQGDAGAQYGLGLMYDLGRGTPQDYAEALKWYRLAAERGDAHVQGNLGVMYVNGEGVPQDYVEAHKWFNLAASRFPASEAAKRDSAVALRDQIASKMTPEQLAEAQKLARDWKPK